MAQFINLKQNGREYMVNVQHITDITCNNERCIVWSSNNHYSTYTIRKNKEPASYNNVIELLRKSTVIGTNPFQNNQE